MKLLAFAASNSVNSINRSLVDYAAQRAIALSHGPVEIQTLDINDYEMPIYSSAREAGDGIPQLAKDLFAQIGDADAVMISFPEHNGSVSAAWKNIFDWMSRIDQKLFQGKPLVVLAASPGGRAGAGVLGYLTMALPHFGAELKASQGVGKWAEAWDAQAASLTKEDDKAAIDAAVSTLLS